MAGKTIIHGTDSTGATVLLLAGSDGTNVAPGHTPFDANGNPQGVAANPFYTLDGNNAAFQGEVTLTVGTADTVARRSLKIMCTAAGNVAVTYADGSTGIWPVAVGTTTLPISITTVNSSGTTATATYANLK